MMAAPCKRILLGRGTVYSRNPDAWVIDLADQRIHGFSRHRMGTVEFRLMTLLLIRAGRVATYGMIFDAVWGDREDGGPNNPRQMISVIASRLRPELRRAGFDLRTEWGVGMVVEPARAISRAA